MLTLAVKACDQLAYKQLEEEVVIEHCTTFNANFFVKNCEWLGYRQLEEKVVIVYCTIFTLTFFVKTSDWLAYKGHIVTVDHYGNNYRCNRIEYKH